VARYVTVILGSVPVASAAISASAGLAAAIALVSGVAEGALAARLNVSFVNRRARVKQLVVAAPNENRARLPADGVGHGQPCELVHAARCRRINQSLSTQWLVQSSSTAGQPRSARAHFPGHEKCGEAE
jgi:hypothetical protein